MEQQPRATNPNSNDRDPITVMRLEWEAVGEVAAQLREFLSSPVPLAVGREGAQRDAQDS